MILRLLLKSTVVVALLLTWLSTSFGAVGAQPLTATSRVSAETVTGASQSVAPLSFVTNGGWADPSVQFGVRDGDKTLLFASNAIALNLPVLPTGPDIMLACANPNMQVGVLSTTVAYSLLQWAFDNVNPNLTLQGTDYLPGATNPFVTANRLQSHPNEPVYAGIAYRGLQSRVNLSFTGQAGGLTADYTLAAGIAPSSIGWHYVNADGVYLMNTGDLHVYTPDGALLISSAPVAWQVQNGLQMPVTVGYQIISDNAVRFVAPLGSYNPGLPLTIALTLD